MTPINQEEYIDYLMSSAKNHEDILKDNEQLRQEITALHQRIAYLQSLIRDDAFAITFQSMGQYRSALLNEFAKLNRFTEKFLTDPRLTAAFEQMNKVAQTIIKEANHENI